MVEYQNQGPSYLKTTITYDELQPDSKQGKANIIIESDYIDHSDHEWGMGISIKPNYYIGNNGSNVCSYEINLNGKWERKQFVQALEKIIAELK